MPDNSTPLRPEELNSASKNENRSGGPEPTPEPDNTGAAPVNNTSGDPGSEARNPSENDRRGDNESTGMDAVPPTKE